DFRSAKWHDRRLTFDFGEALAEDASLMTRNTFSEVVETHNGGAPSKFVEATLTPKVPYMGMQNVQTSRMDLETVVTIKLEWALSDKGGALVWADTITGKGTCRDVGWERYLTRAVEDVISKSQKAIVRSQAIQGFVDKRAR